MNLDEGQVEKVRHWVDQGLKAADIQTRLLDELGLKLTYAEVRFLLGDLQLRPKDPPPAPKAADAVLGSAGGPGAPTPASPAGGPPLRTTPMAGAPGAPQGGGVTMSVDDITRPSMVVSGKVTFSDGTTGEWGIDRMGRPILKTGKPGYQPPQEDLMDFQMQLEQVLARFGY